MFVKSWLPPCGNICQHLAPLQVWSCIAVPHHTFDLCPLRCKQAATGKNSVEKSKVRVAPSKSFHKLKLNEIQRSYSGNSNFSMSATVSHSPSISELSSMIFSVIDLHRFTSFSSMGVGHGKPGLDFKKTSPNKPYDFTL